MTQNLMRAAVIALLASLAAACATPTYPTHTGYVAPPPLASATPKYPITQPAPAPSSPPAAATPPETPPTAPPPPAAVETQSLPPVTEAAPAPVAAPPPPPPAYVAPTPPPPVASTYTPAPVRTRPPPARFVTAGRVVDATGMFRDYEVQRHDHIDAIARDLGTTRAVIVEANHLTPPYSVQPGQHLKVPVAKAYEAEAGDTLPLVAKRFDVAADDLAQLNDLPVRGRLKQGERIALPATFHDQGPTRVRTPVEEVRAAPPPRPLPTATPYRAYASAGPATAPRSAPTVPSASYAPPAPRPSPTPYIAHPYTPSSPSVYANAQRPAYAPIAPPTAEASHPASDTEIATAARGRFIWPVRGEILSGFGSKGVGRRNDGVDVKSPQGTAVHAAAGGDVVYAGNQVPGFGNLVLVKHADGWVTAYAHLDKVSVQMRQAVIQGQEIGQVGLSGGVVEPELHFEVRYAPTPADKARPVDPMLVLPKLAG